MRRTAESLISHIPAGPAHAANLGRLRYDRQEQDRVLMTRVGLQFPAVLSFEEWERAGRRLSGLVNSSLWCLGDWLVFGKKHYADRYMRAICVAGLQYQTLRNYAWVSRRFEWSRRRPLLTFQHHAEVASMPSEKQDWWLDRAEQMMWTTKQLRTHIREQRNDDDDSGRVRTSLIPRMEVLNNRLERWRKAANRSGMAFDSWVMQALDGAAAQVLSEDQALACPIYIE